MASKIVWTERALADLKGITYFISQDSVHFARITLQRITNAAERLIDFPESGRIVPESESWLVREVICSPYRIIYRIIEDRVQILTVLHAARILKSDQLHEPQ